MTKDYYKILDVSPSSTDGEIKKSYRRLAMKYHPDRNKTNKQKAADKFKEINEAYDVLKDPKTRRAYDAARSTGREYTGSSSGGDPFSDFRAGFQETEAGFDINDIFSFFTQKSHNAEKVDDLYTELSLDLEEVYFRKKVSFTVQAKNLCSRCHGQGGFRKQQCSKCHGRGTIYFRSRYTDNFMSVQKICDLCKGTGHIYAESCSTCHGRRFVEQERTVTVQLPFSLQDQDTIRISRQGNMSTQGIRSSLYAKVNIKPHAIFRLKGHDLYANLTISFRKACLGDKILIPSLDASKKKYLQIKPGTPSGKVYKCRGMGMPKGKDTYGDLYLTTTISVPKTLTKDQINVLETLFPE